MRVIDELKITQAFRRRNGAKILRAFIVILFLMAFQLYSARLMPVWAVQKLPIFQTDALKSHFLQSTLKAVEASGYHPKLVQEEDFLFNLKASEHPYVLVPLSNQVSASALAILSRYVSEGGQIILLVSGEMPDPSVQRVIQLVGLTFQGAMSLPQDALFYWKGASLPGGEALSQGSRILLFQPGLNETVLATWGNQYPAILSTDKGALLNWPWGQQLSRMSNLMVLAKVMPLAKPDSIVFAEAKTEKSLPPALAMAQPAIPPVMPEIPTQTVTDAPTPLAPQVDPNPAMPVKKALIPIPPVIASPNTLVAVHVYPDSPRQIAAAPTTTPVIAPKSEPAAKPAATDSPQPALTPPLLPPAEAKPQISAPKQNAAPRAPFKSESSPVASQKPYPQSNPQSAEEEVLNNILGTPAPSAPKEVPKPDDPILKDKMDAAGQTDPAQATPSSLSGQPQKRFSFLDPEAAAVVAPEFDYGTYSFNLRILEDYNRRINDAIETSRQLSLDIPEEKVKALLAEARQHKRKFESLYLNNQTQAGLDEFAQARRMTLQALALTSASPRVEGRAIWLDRSTIIEAKNPVELKKLMGKLHQAGINIVYFETFNAGFPIYPSAILKHNPMVQGWDPLKAAVEEGHRLGMEVHAWVWAFAVGNRRHNPLIGQPDTYPGPVLVDSGLMNEALRNRDGGLNVDNKQNEYWLDPASDKGRAFLLSVYKEIVTHYDVDGLQLDYIRYPFQTSYTRMGFDPVGREKFYRASGQSLDSLDDYTAKLWIAWKTYQVSSFVQQVSTTLKAIKPDLKLSAAVFPMKRESRIVTIQQDWETWIDNGWVDTLSPMSYTSDPHRLQGMFDYVQSSPQKRSLIYPGIALHRLDGGQLVEQLEALRQHGGLGATLFAGAHLDQEKIDTLGQGPFKEQNSVTPHKDVVKSLQLILDDYRQKFTVLQGKGALSELPVDQLKAITEPMAQLNASLTALSAFKSPTSMPGFQLKQAEQQLQAFQAGTNVWLQSQQQQHPFRAQYFNQRILLLTELLGYLNDKNNGSVATFHEPTPPVVAKPATPPVTLPGHPASAAKPAPNSVTATTGPATESQPAAN